MTTPAVAPKPLMLKEYLELDHDDDDGLVLRGGVATVRSLLDAELRGKTAGRSAAVQDAAAAANGNALGKFSAAIEAVKRRCLSASRQERAAAFSVLSWTRKKQSPAGEQKSATVGDATWANAVCWQSLRIPSPVGSSRTNNPSACAVYPALAYDPATAAGEAKKEHSPYLSSSSLPSENEEEATVASTTATPSPETEFEDTKKARLSPVLIEEEGEFYRSLDYFERTTEQLLHRIRRFELLAELDSSRSSDGECDEDEESSSLSSSRVEEEERAWELLGRLKANPPPRGGEKLLLDFFIQGGKAGGGGGGGVLSLRQRPRQGATKTSEMLHAARQWIDGRPRGEAEQDSGHGEAATLREMERDGSWKCFHEEEDELGRFRRSSSPANKLLIASAESRKHCDFVKRRSRELRYESPGRLKRRERVERGRKSNKKIPA